MSAKLKPEGGSGGTRGGFPPLKDAKPKEKDLSPLAGRPFIAVNADLVTPKNGTPFVRLNLGYVDAIMAAGGLPIVLPPLRKDNHGEIDLLLEQCAGIVLTGGADMDPRRNGQAMTSAVNPMPARREDADRYLLARIFDGRIPVLGIGVGMQQLNVFAGGTLHLHLPTDNPRAMPHFDQTGAPHRHMVLIEEGTRLDDIYGTQELRVNSTHHQAINQIGKRMRVAAKAAGRRDRGHRIDRPELVLRRRAVAPGSRDRQRARRADLRVLRAGRRASDRLCTGCRLRRLAGARFEQSEGVENDRSLCRVVTVPWSSRV